MTTDTILPSAPTGLPPSSVSSATQKVLQRVLRTASGSVDSSDPLVLFLYLLMRDHVHAGLVEQLMYDSQIASGGIEYTNGYLANYAKHLANLLVPSTEEKEFPDA